MVTGSPTIDKVNCPQDKREHPGVVGIAQRAIYIFPSQSASLTALPEESLYTIKLLKYTYKTKN